MEDLLRTKEGSFIREEDKEVSLTVLLSFFLRHVKGKKRRAKCVRNDRVQLNAAGKKSDAFDAKNGTRERGRAPNHYRNLVRT